MGLLEANVWKWENDYHKPPHAITGFVHGDKPVYVRFGLEFLGTV